MSTLKPPLNARDHVRGNPSSRVSLVEFGDFECPFCGEAYGVVKLLEEALGDRVAFAFRHFPIVGSHPHAFLAAEAAEAAGAQGRFWEMHDVLYEHQDALEPTDLAQYAASIGIDVRQFVDDLRTHRFAEQVREDLHSGAVSGVNGTPSFFINGRRHDGSFDFETLYEALTGGVGVAPPL
jgi:protein-disulfide isomerase